MTPINYNDPNEMWRNNDYDPYKGLNDDERLKAGCFQLITIVCSIIAAIAICALLGSCTTTKYVPVIEHHTDTLRIVQHQRDSIYLSDSIYVNDFVRDDTVYKNVERWHTQYRDRTVRDTIYQSRTDSVPVPYPVIREAERHLSLIQQVLMGTGGAALMALVVFIGWRLKRWLPM